MPLDRDQKFGSFARSFSAVTGCWVILIVIMALRIHFTSVISENNAKLIAENLELEKQKQELETKNQQLETAMKSLNETLEDMETKWNELNVSRAQWSIDQYCPIVRGVRKCDSCQRGWFHEVSSCYTVHNAQSTDQKTWDEAQADCTGKISELAVINNAAEKEFIKGKSWAGEGIDGYWIGLRVVDGKWVWLDGRDLTETSWIQPATPTEGHCAISVPKDIPNKYLQSVNCGNRNAWICEKKALSLTPP
ncbi:C-type lectin lectoxin-Phi1-like [Pagrus major]|uniref:C-type lectin lectoxin-Phi1-like n=1 Tax=Pagrus major TaxID=143350 RepID=UPI003CC83AF4